MLYQTHEWASKNMMAQWVGGEMSVDAGGGGGAGGDGWPCIHLQLSIFHQERKVNHHRLYKHTHARTHTRT